MSPKVCALRNGLKSLCFVALLALLPACLGMAPPVGPAADGEEIFRQKCSGCHTIGGGRLSGPDLINVAAQRDRDWLARFILEPDKVLAEGDPLATGLLKEYGNVSMPAMGLSAGQVQDVIAYLESTGGGSAAALPVPAASAPPAAGDPGRGETLFAGTLDFENDGPPCLACHSAGRTGLLGGGALGPDLTQVADRYGAGLQAALAGVPWPTMAPIYARHPLTPQEQADLAAFLQTLSGQRPANWEWVLLALSLAGLAGALVVIGFLWRGRLRGVRRQMVEKARIK